MPGWIRFWPSRKLAPSDSTVALVLGMGLFFVPKRPCFSLRKLDLNDTILKWRDFQGFCPWGAILLIGSGMALSRASEWSGFSHVLSEVLRNLEGMNRSLTLFLVIIFAGVVTEFIHSTAAANLIAPILIELSFSIHENPLYFVVAGTIASSFGFILPVGAGSIALAFGYGRIDVIDMVKCGILVNIMGGLLLMGITMGYSPVVLQTDEREPVWLNMTQEMCL